MNQEYGFQQQIEQTEIMISQLVLDPFDREGLMVDILDAKASIQSIPVQAEREKLYLRLVEKELELGLIEAKEADKAKKKVMANVKAEQKEHDTAKASQMATNINSPDGRPFITQGANSDKSPRLVYVIPATEDSAPIVRQMTNFDIVEWKITQGKNEQTSELTIKHLPEGHSVQTIRTKKVELNASSLSSMPAFAKAIRKVFNGAVIEEVSRSQNSDLNLLIKFLHESVSIRREIARDFYGFDHDEDGNPYFHHADITTDDKDSLIVKSPRFQMQEDIIYRGASFKGLWHIPQAANPAETIVTFLTNFSKMYNFGKAFSALGWMVSGMIHQYLRENAESYQHPILYMWGPADIGKSTLVRNLFRLFGWAGVNGKSEEYVFSGSNASNRDILSSYNVPVIIGEFRNAFQNAEEMTRTLLAVYDGMSSGKKIKGKDDTWEQGSIPYRAALAILSNNIITDAAARSRFLEIQATKEDLPALEHRDKYRNIEAMQAGSIGAILVPWLLNNWDKLPGIIAQADQTIPRVDDDGRSKNVLKAVAYGLNIFDKMASEYGINVREFINIDYSDVYGQTRQLISQNKLGSEDAEFCNWVIEEINGSGNAIPFWTVYTDDRGHQMFVTETGIIEKYVRRDGKSQKIMAATAELKQTLVQHSNIYKIAYSKRLQKVGADPESSVKRLIIDLTVASQEYEIGIEACKKPELGNLVLFNGQKQA